MATKLAGWSTPSARDWKDTEGMATTGTNPDGSERDRLDQLGRQVQLAGWPTPMAGNPGSETYNQAGNTDSSRRTVALLSGWPTPRSVEAGHGTGNPDRANDRKSRLEDTIYLCSATPSPMRLKATGEMLTGSSAQMDGGGPLKPEHSRWLMGLPSVWDDCAVTAIASMRKLRKRLSERL